MYLWQRCGSLLVPKKTIMEVLSYLLSALLFRMTESLTFEI